MSLPLLDAFFIRRPERALIANVRAQIVPTRSAIIVVLLSVVLASCGTPRLPPTAMPAPPPRVSIVEPAGVPRAAGNEVALYALSLLETGYRFGGKKPEAGLDCSGMVRFVYRQATGLELTGSAADMARLGRPVDMADLRPGDLVFFNTSGRPYSHVGIYIGDGRFVHAPSSGGAVRTDSLKSGWFAARFEAARTYFD